MNPFLDFNGEPDFQSRLSMPPRSVLFSLVPDGVGTSEQESLLSLITRTSRAHAVSPRRLIAKIFSRDEPVISKLAYAKFFCDLAGTANGLGQYAELFVSAMERLTGRPNLRHLTMLSWRGLFPRNGQGLLARHPRWCPMCLYQQHVVGKRSAVFPLVWSLEVYRSCSIHLCKLEEQCPHCGKTQPFLPRFPDLGICDHCRQPLAGIRPRYGRDSFESWVADAVGDMVTRQSASNFAPDVGHFREFLREQIAALSDGNRAAFCRALGFNEHGLNGWLNKGERPSPTQFLALCYGLELMPANIFDGAQPQLTGTCLKRPLGKLKGRQAISRPDRKRREELESILLAKLNDADSLPVSRIAAELGVGPACLRYWFPDICAQLSERHRSMVKQRSTAYRAKQCLRVEALVLSVAEEGRYPSLRQVNYLLRKEGMSLVQPHLLQAYRRARQSNRL